MWRQPLLGADYNSLTIGNFIMLFSLLTPFFLFFCATTPPQNEAPRVFKPDWSNQIDEDVHFAMINDNNQILCGLRNGSQIFSEIQNSTGYTPLNFHARYLINSGMLFSDGCATFLTSSLPGPNPTPFSIPNLCPNRCVVNDIGMIAGFTLVQGVKRPFIHKGKTTLILDQNSEFFKKIENQGYLITDLEILALNNMGSIAGVFGYGKKHPQTHTPREIGKKLFFYNNRSVLIQDLCPNFKPSAMELNASDTALLIAEDDRMCVWNTRKNQLQALPENFLSVTLPHGYFHKGRINNNHMIIGRISNDKNKPAVMIRNKVYLLETLLNKNLRELETPFGNHLAVESIDSLLQINNRNQILGFGKSWGKQVPVIIELSEELN